ncbi:MAG: hypothetical protein NZ583_02420 [Desulfobacterota bacterium]|nr:hypothetical protein [Thermodesulfobacteriota bacterium]MDW8001740.1 hypothetical protein [Deltaproteobacteria bacterium]
MDREFHYYITYFLALRAGFLKEEAHIIAYSSQYTDDNTLIFKVSSKKGLYVNYVSQTFNILRPQKKLLRIYPIFHFMPGSKEEVQSYGFTRKDGKVHVLNTIPGNKNSLLILEDAINSRNLFRIGIACHTFSDTYAHQNFVGLPDPLNSKANFQEKLIPNVGHADFRRKPDRPYLVWEDVRLKESLRIVNNKDRVLNASREIYKKLCSITEKDPYGEDYVINSISSVIGDPLWKEEREESRIEKYKDLLGKDFIPYERTLWLKEALIFDAFSSFIRAIDAIFGSLGLMPFKIPAKAKEDFENSNWLKFQEAVKEHQRLALDLLGPVFGEVEIDNL